MHKPVAQHHLVVDLHRVAVNECFELSVSLLAVAFQLVGVHLGKSKLLARTVGLLHQLETTQHIGVVFLMSVELHEHVQDVAAVAVVSIKALVGVDGTGVAVCADIVLCHTFLVAVVARAQRGSLLYAVQRHGVLPQLCVIGRLQEVGFSGIGVYLEAMDQQIEGCIVVAGSLTAHRFEEEVVVTAAVIV